MSRHPVVAQPMSAGLVDAARDLDLHIGIQQKRRSSQAHTLMPSLMCWRLMQVSDPCQHNIGTAAHARPLAPHPMPWFLNSYLILLLDALVGNLGVRRLLTLLQAALLLSPAFSRPMTWLLNTYLKALFDALIADPDVFQHHCRLPTCPGSSTQSWKPSLMHWLLTQMSAGIMTGQIASAKFFRMKGSGT